MRQTLIDTFLEWRNNYLTIELYAEHNMLTVEQARQLIALARWIYYSEHPEA